MRVAIEPVTLRFKAPVATAFGELRERELLRLTIEGSDGVAGRGEAAPLEPYDGVPLALVREALEAYRRVLEHGDGATGAQLLDACREIAELPQALAAVDLALWDRAGRREGLPVARMITEDAASSVAVNATLGAVDRTGAAAAAADAARAGYRCVKVKVGVGDDAGRVAAVRAAVGPEVDLRLDANGAWDVEEAVRAIDVLAPAGLELVEEPVHGIEGVRAVRERVAVRIAIDETVAEPGALGAGVADAVCLKIARSGGISALIAQATLARTSGAEVYLASSFDGPFGIAAALHCAAALRPAAACGLATLALFEGLEDVFPVVGGAIAVPAGPGLGARAS